MVVLVVDDDPIMRRALARAVGESEVLAAETVRDGLSIARRRQPDAIVLDVLFGGAPDGMPAIQGFRAAAPRASIIVVTGEYSEYDEGRAIALGARAYLEKGDVGLLRSVIARAVASFDKRFGCG